ncbi:MAG: amino acid permease [Verrucomicrobiales bacterium]|nr:amino acid permease [Verrucomicrobiales bacterium]
MSRAPGGRPHDRPGHTADAARAMNARPTPQLSLFDAVCLIVGIIIGAGIYQMSPTIAAGAGGPWQLLGLWLLGGALSLCGALCYAELASAWPRQGGDYVYLSRAYGRWAGFLFAWAQLAIVRPGDIAVMAFAFATYAVACFSPPPMLGFLRTEQALAAAAVIALTLINVLGVREGKWTQNLLTTAKALGLVLIVAAAFAAPTRPEPAAQPGAIPWSLALIFVLFTYGGWNEMAYVAAEVKRPERNIVRALALGLGAVTLLYLLVNAAFVYALGFDGLKASQAVGADAVRGVFPEASPRLVSALICISALGAVNGLIFTGARISYALGADHRLFRWLGQWHPRRATPAAALMVQGALALVLVLALGSFVSAVLYTASAVYAFYLGTTLAVIVLRRKEPHVPRPVRVPGYPVTPLVFAGVCAWLIWSAAVYKPLMALFTGAVLAFGGVLWFWSRRLER